MRTTKLMIAIAALAAVASCSTDHPKQCRRFGQASICLQKVGGTHYEPQASGLQPGSAIHLHVAAPGLDQPSGGEPPLAADPSGHWPAGTGMTTGNAPTGAVTITITATSAAGTPVIATFTL